MQDHGWIKLHRKILDWEWYDDPKSFKLFIHLLLSANHTEKRWHGVSIMPGQLVFGRTELAKRLGFTEQSLRTALTRLKSTSEITIKSTNKFSVLTIIKWEDYQSDDKKSTSKSTSKLTNKQPTNNQQTTTTKECKNDKNEKKEIINSKTSLQPDEVNLLLQEFYKINPTINFGNKTQRKAAKDLIDKFTLDQAVLMVKWYSQQTSDRFCPVATTPLAFWNKLGEIKIYADKLKTPTKGSITRI